MEPDAAAKFHYLELPTLIFGPVEVRRLERELEALEEYLRQANIRTPGKQAAMPKTSHLLEALAGNNKLNLLVQKDRERLRIFLANLDKKAPVLHISFAADPSSAFTAKLVTWLRNNIHPYTLLQIGLQPGITAGCVVRANSKVFDFSLRKRFTENRSFLLASQDKATVPKEAVAQ